MDSQEFLLQFNQYASNLEGINIKKNSQTHHATYFFNQEMFAILDSHTTPLRLALRCDYRLAKHLKSSYDEVVNPKLVSPTKWIEIVLTGQLTINEVIDLFRHGYEIAKKSSLESGEH